jgi:ADP-heptose:LPS heptosyltransferase
LGNKKVINAVGRTDLGQCAALLEKCSLLIANDSGPLHMACALGVPTVSVFGPVDEQVYGPVGEAFRHRVVTAAVECRPCYANFSKPHCRTMRCLQDIKAADVIQAAVELLEKARSPGDEVRKQ